MGDKMSTFRSKIMEKLYIVIPAYNEEMNITSVAREWHTGLCHSRRAAAAG